jgi:hypothetical protein
MLALFGLAQQNGSHDEVLLGRGELQALAELRSPCRIDILIRLACNLPVLELPTFVPHANDMHVAAILDTIRAVLSVFSDIMKGGIDEVESLHQYRAIRMIAELGRDNADQGLIIRSILYVVAQSCARDCNDETKLSDVSIRISECCCCGGMNSCAVPEPDDINPCSKLIVTGPWSQMIGSCSDASHLTSRQPR